MTNKIYTLDVRQVEDYYEVTIPELAVSAIGATFDEAVSNGNRAIAIALMPAKKPTRKPGQPRKRKSVA